MRQDTLDKRWKMALAIAQIGLAAYAAWQKKKQAEIAQSRLQALDAAVRAAPLPSVLETAPQAPASGGSDTAAGAPISTLPQVALAAGRAWLARRAASKGAALALYMLFSLAPMLVLVVTVTGFLLDETTVTTALVAQMRGVVGEQGAAAIETMLSAGRGSDAGVIAGIVSMVLVLVSATTAFAELKESLDELWEVKAPGSSGLVSLLRERLLSFGLLLVLALMLLASLAISTALDALGNVWNNWWSDTSFVVLAKILGELVSFAIVSVIFAVIFKYLPGVRLAWKDVAVGALLTAVLFTLGKTAIGLYVGYADFASTYGAAGSVVVLVTWIYYSAQIFFYGALFTHQYATTLGSRPARAGARQPQQLPHPDSSPR